MQFLLAFAQPAAYEGIWESRVVSPFAVEDRGPLSAPILVDVHGRDLQSAIDNWSLQPAIHAIWQHAGLITLQLKRYTPLHNRTGKNKDPLES